MLPVATEIEEINANTAVCVSLSHSLSHSCDGGTDRWPHRYSMPSENLRSRATSLPTPTPHL